MNDYVLEKYLNDKYLVNVDKTLNTDSVCEYAFVMMLSEYILGYANKSNDVSNDNDRNNVDGKDRNNIDGKNNINGKNNNNTYDTHYTDKNNIDRNIIGPNNIDRDIIDQDNIKRNNIERDNVNRDKGDNENIEDKRLISIKNDLYKLYEETNKMRKRKQHIVQIRSIPVSDYWYALRHYFVRIDELVDVHPGNEQRICLRGWYRNTDIGSDTLESSYKLCKNCLDESLPKLWEGAKKFHFVFQNCDQCCNRSHQSIGVGIVCFITLSVALQVLTYANFTPVVLLVIVYILSFASFYYGHLYADYMLPWLGYNPAVSNKNARSFVCRHLRANR